MIIELTGLPILAVVQGDVDQPNYWYSALNDIEGFLNTIAIATIAGCDVGLSERFKMWVIRRRFWKD